MVTIHEIRRTVWLFEATRSKKKGLRSPEWVHKFLEHHKASVKMENVEWVRSVMMSAIKNIGIIERMRHPDAVRQIFAAAANRIIQNKNTPAMDDPTIMAMRKSIMAAHLAWKGEPLQETKKISIELWVKAFIQNPTGDTDRKDLVARMVNRLSNKLPMREPEEERFREYIVQHPEKWAKLQEKFAERIAESKKRQREAKEKAIKYFKHLSTLEENRPREDRAKGHFGNGRRPQNGRPHGHL